MYMNNIESSSQRTELEIQGFPAGESEKNAPECKQAAPCVAQVKYSQRVHRGKYQRGESIAEREFQWVPLT